MKLRRFKKYSTRLLEALTALEVEQSDEKKAELFEFAYNNELDDETKSFLQGFCFSIKDKEKLGRILVDVIQNAKVRRIG